MTNAAAAAAASELLDVTMVTGFNKSVFYAADYDLADMRPRCGSLIFEKALIQPKEILPGALVGLSLDLYGANGYKLPLLEIRKDKTRCEEI